MARLLNFGCGDRVADGWDNLDREDHGQRWVVDIESEPLPFLDGSIDGVVASHSLQEIGYHSLPGALAELYRVLRPGGVLRVLSPNLLASIAAYLRGDRAWFPVNDSEPSIDDGFCCYLNWFGTARTVWTPQRTIDVLVRAGFRDAREMPFGRSQIEGLADLDDREPEEQVIVEATR